MKRVAPKIFILICFLTLLGGCHIGPKYEVPCTTVPEDWKTNAEGTVAPPVENWWDLFNDSTLSELENKAVLNNPDLYVSLERINEARAVAGVEKANLYPQISIDPVYANLENLIKLYGVPANNIPGFQQIVRVHEMEYILPLNMTYELDLWQKYRGKYRSAMLDAEAQMYAFQSSLLTVTTDLASNYYNLRALDTQVELLELILVDLRYALKLREDRFRTGLDSYMEYLNAEQELKSAEADLEDSIRQRALFENSIAILIGEPSSNFRLDPNPLKHVPPLVPAGLPSTIMLKRPDIAQAERKMASLHALIGSAYASFFPAVAVTGGVGFLSPVFKEFLHWKSRFWDIAAAAFQSIFDGGRNRSNLAAAKARFHEAEGNYKKTVLSAFQEVEDALVNIETQSNQSDDLEVAAKAAEKSAKLSRLRYEKGVANFLEVANYEITELNAIRKWMNVLGVRHQSTIQLIKSIGGSWDTQSCVETASLDAPSEEEGSAAQSK